MSENGEIHNLLRSNRFRVALASTRPETHEEKCGGKRVRDPAVSVAALPNRNLEHGLLFLFNLQGPKVVAGNLQNSEPLHPDLHGHS
jgi:hypothetical protein